MDMLSQKQKIIAIIGIVIIVIIIIYYYIVSTRNMYEYEQNEIVETTEEDTETEEKAKIIVHITGAVKNNGIVEVEEDSRINDVIEAAGGITEEADISQVNLAYIIKDGQKIYIPSKNDQENIEDLEIISENAGIKIIEAENTTQSNGIVNINTATKEELQKLPGIGESTANKIITYRNENGKFKSIEDIKNISGIGDAKFETIKNYIKV